MKSSHVNVGSRIWEMLGEVGVHRLTEVLHPRRGDCQICVRPLAGHDISLAVDVINPLWAIATLNHTSCRLTCWNDSGTALYVAGACTFALGHWETRLSDHDPGFPALVLNPALESVFLELAQGAWRPVLPDEYLRLGMINEAELAARKREPLLDKVTVLLHSDGFVQLDLDGMKPYPSEDGDRTGAPARMVDLLRRERAALVVVSQAADPADVHDLGQLRAVLTHPMTVFGEAVVYTV